MHSEATQTLRAGYSKAEPNFFAPPQTPFLGVWDGQNLISWNGHYLHLQTQFGDDRCMQFRFIMVTDPQTYRQGRLQYTAPQFSKQCNRCHCCRCTGFRNGADMFSKETLHLSLSPAVLSEWLRERTEPLDIFFSTHHSVVFYFQCSVYWWKGSVRF